MVQFAVTLKDAEWTVFKDGVPIEAGMARSRAIERAEQLAFEAEEGTRPIMTAFCAAPAAGSLNGVGQLVSI